MNRPLDRHALYLLGVERLEQFCAANAGLMPTPRVRSQPKDAWDFDACAWYRPDGIRICVEKCARPAHTPRCWSWPGSTSGREPFGVIAHELGHHADVYKSGLTKGYRGTYSRDVRRTSGERPLTCYAPNDGEWFAEMFRLFVTNHLLLRLVRPRTWDVLYSDWTPVSYSRWEEDMSWAYELGENVPTRIITALTSRIRTQR